MSIGRNPDLATVRPCFPRVGWLRPWGLVAWLMAAAPALAGQAPAWLVDCTRADTARDLVTHVSAEIRGRGGQVLHQGEYERFWLQGDTDGKFSRRAMLFVEEPLAYYNVAYLVWRFVDSSKRVPEDWVYVPRSQKVRRATAKDPDDRWWQRVDADLDFRPEWPSDADVHPTAYGDDESGEHLEIVPRQPSAYAYLILTVHRGTSNNTCLIKAAEYLDAKRKLIRSVTMSWHHLDGVWYRNMININDVQDQRQSTYLLSHTRVNVGLQGEDFLPQRLRGRPELAPVSPASNK